MRRAWVLVAAGLAATLALLITLTAVLTPDALNPAFDAALRFTDAVLDTHDDAAASALLAPGLSAWAAAHCRDGVSACVGSYIPDEWGRFVDAVYRRSIPDGSDAWDIQVIATFDAALTAGFSGVCIYLRAEDTGGGAWRIARWSGWVSCSEEDGLENLRSNPDAPNRAP